MGTSADPDADYKVKYEYDNETDRIETVKGHSLPNNGAQYTYPTGGHPVEKIEFKQDTVVQASITRTYHDARDLVTDVKNKWFNLVDPIDPNSIVSQYTYDYDSLWPPKWVVRQSEVGNSAFANDHHDKLTIYNGRNELTESKRYNNTSPPSESSPDSDYHRWYAYDTAGNCTWHQRGNDPNLPATYNALNPCTTAGDPNNPYGFRFSYDEDHNLTAGRVVSLIREYDLATVCRWIRNSSAVAARRHVTSIELDADLRRAAGLGPSNAQQKAQQSATGDGDHGMSGETSDQVEHQEKPEQVAQK